jgi:chromosome segregation protein
MDSTRQNLARLTDVLSELARQMNSLNRQAKKAEKYKQISEDLRSRELALSATKYKCMKAQLEEINAELLRLREAEVSSSAELSRFEVELEEKRLSISGLERELDGASQQLYGVKNAIKLSEAEIGHKRSETQSISGQNENYLAEISALREKLTELNGRISKANEILVDADIKLTGSSSLVEGLASDVNEVKVVYDEISRKCEEYSSRINDSSREAANLTSSLDHLQRRHIEIGGRIAKNQSEMDGIDERRVEIERELKTRENDIGEAKQLKFSISDEAGTVESDLKSYAEKLHEAESRVMELRDQVSDRRSRLESIIELRKNLEGYRDGVRAVLARTDENGEKFAGIQGTVGEIFETEEEYETALGAVLGERLQYVVVKSHEEGVEAIDYLQSAACGRSSFIPVGVRAAEAVDAIPDGEGVIAPMRNLVRFSDEHKLISDYLLGGVVLVDDLKNALRLWGDKSGGHTFVTKDGCVIDPSGVVTGGCEGSVEQHLVAQKRKVRELGEELSRLKKELVEAEGSALKLSERVRSLKKRSDELGRDSHSEELRLVGKERDLERLRDELSRYERERDKITVETAALAGELAEVGRERAEARIRLEKSNHECAICEGLLVSERSELTRVAEQLKEREKKLIELNIGLSQANDRAEAAAAELKGLIRDKVQALLGIGRRAADVNTGNWRMVVLNREIEALKAELDMAISATSGLEKTQRVLREKYDAETAGLRDREQEIREIRKLHEEALGSFHEMDIKLTEHRAKVLHLSEGVMERYHLDLDTCCDDYARDDIDLEAEDAMVVELKDKIEKIGSVNVDAIGEYSEMVERHAFLSRQYDDLNNSLENLSKAIAKINRTSRQRFRRAFENVDKQFQELFPRLFKGGKARLMLTDEEDLLETGIEIIVQPPGKKLQSITLLSGGEKALTAVALIFSIFLIKPSPFCLLDEVDAPLDDANIDRFNDLIRSMTQHSQFILITHNKRTMELADLLYGVTMEEAGVSKMVSVRLGQEKSEEPQVA